MLTLSVRCISAFVLMDYKFTGKERDTETGLDYFGARYYGSSMGRWMSPDWAQKPEAVPYSTLGDPQSLNLYGYVDNNPLNKADEDGHDWKGFKSAMVKAYGEVSAKASFGFGIGLGGKAGEWWCEG